MGRTSIPILQKSRALRVFLLVQVVVGVMALVMTSGKMFSACGTSNQYAMDALRECPRASELLGEDIHAAYGWGCGSLEEGPAGAHSAASIPVAGDKDRGEFTYQVNIVGGMTNFSGALVVGDVTVDMTECALPTEK